MTATDDIDHSSVLLPTWAETWLLGFRSRKTRAAYRIAAMRLLAAMQRFAKEDSDRELPTVSERMVLTVADWFRDSRPRPPSPSLWNQTLSGWRSIFSYMMIARPPGATRDDDPTVRLEHLKKEDLQRPTPKLSEVRRLWRAVMSKRVFDNATAVMKIRILRERAILALLIGCGLRVAEIQRLTRKQFDLEARMLRKVLRKRNKVVDIPWHPNATRHFRAILGHAAPGADLPVFPSREDPAVPISSDTIRKSIKHLCRECGIPVYTPHAFRRFAITMVARKDGLDRARVFADHADISTTYGYLDGRHERPTPEIYDELEE